jgi:hypothetical protein
LCMISYFSMPAGLPLLVSPRPASPAAEFFLDFHDTQWLVGPMLGLTARECCKWQLSQQFVRCIKDNVGPVV